jgi:hypothetical protein
MHACKAIQGSHHPYPFWLNLHQKAFHICKLAASRSLLFRTSALVSLSSLASSPALLGINRYPVIAACNLTACSLQPCSLQPCNPQLATLPGSAALAEGL